MLTLMFWVISTVTTPGFGWKASDCATYGPDWQDRIETVCDGRVVRVRMAVRL